MNDKSLKAGLFGAALGLGLLAGVILSQTWFPPVAEPLPACPTEDSDNCYWDADTQGNGQGNDSVVIVPEELP